MSYRITSTASAALVVTLLLSACAITRVEPPAAVKAEAAFKEGQGLTRSTAPVPDAWWTMFKDPVLDDLQQRLVIGNENLKASVAAVASARASYEASRLAFGPTLSAGLSGARSGGGNNDAGNSFGLTANASWELDLWGRLAQASSGAQASLQASANDLAAAQLSAQALLAQTYFSLRTADAQAELLVRSVAAYQRALELTETRYKGGVAAQTDVLQSRTQLRNAQAQLAETTAQRAQLEHAIAVLLGLPPSAFSLSASAVLPAAPEVPELLPASLLQRRPDIAAAQSRVASAYAEIGIADAAWLPDLSLSASAGYRGSSLSKLVSGPNLLWSLGSSLTQAILDNGQRKLASAQARANAERLTASYRQTVLTALQEVEDNLVLAQQLAQQARLQAEALQSAQRNLEITLDQYRAGTVGYLNVVTAQTSALNAESSLLSVRNRQLAAVNQLLKNIAGRWSAV